MGKYYTPFTDEETEAYSGEISKAPRRSYSETVGLELKPRPFPFLGEGMGQALRKLPTPSGKRCSRSHPLPQEHMTGKPTSLLEPAALARDVFPGLGPGGEKRRAGLNSFLSNSEYFTHCPESDQAAFLP